MSSASALDLWEFELLATELDRALETVRPYYHEIGPYELPVNGLPLDHRQSLALVNSLSQQIQGWVSSLHRIVKQDMTMALGPEGVPGDADALKSSAAKVGRIMVALTGWEDTVTSTWPAAHWQKAFALLHGGTIPISDAIENLLREIRAVPARARRGETCVRISVDIAEPPRWQELPEAIKHAIRTGGSFVERHPVISGIVAGELLSKIFR